MSRWHRLRVAEVRRETVEAVSVALEVPEALRGAFVFVPGQFLTLRTRLGGEEVRRSYSICSGLDDPELRIAIKHVPDGRFSSWAHAGLRVGDWVEVMPPEGRFGVELDPAAARVYVAFAAGSGITPIMAILRTVLAREPGSQFVLFYGSRSYARIIFREDLEDLKDRYLDRLTVVHVLSREQQDLPVLSGRLDAAKVRALLPGIVPPERVDHAFICGPGSMIGEVSAALAEMGVPPERVHVERFTPAPDAAPRPVRPQPAADAPARAWAEIVANGVRTEVPVAEGETVLEAGLRAGLDLPWSCRGGMCTTCRAKLTGGRVEMALNYGLEPWEIAAGYVLTCQSHPVTERVSVDYDHV